MAYKQIEYGFTFADMAVQKITDKNRTLLFLRQIENTIDWEPIQGLLIKHYEIGKTKVGALELEVPLRGGYR